MTDDEDKKPDGYKIGSEKLCKVTDRAATQIARLLKDQDRSFGALRLAVVGGGLSGLKYKFDLIDGPVAKDILIITQNVKVVIDVKSALFVSGSTLDFCIETDDFVVVNPKIN